MSHKFPYKWNLADGYPAKGVEKHNLKVFGTCQIGSFPLDYNFKKIDVKYLIGMSVPPIMTAQVSYQIYLQWFKNLNKNND
jgi:hypothetical protein